MPGPLALVSEHYGRQQGVLLALRAGHSFPPGTVTPAQLAQLHRQIHAHAQLLIQACNSTSLLRGRAPSLRSIAAACCVCWRLHTT